MSIRKVLVVDDSPTDLANIKSIVTEAGCIVVTADAIIDQLKAFL